MKKTQIFNTKEYIGMLAQRKKEKTIKKVLETKDKRIEIYPEQGTRYITIKHHDDKLYIEYEHQEIAIEDIYDMCDKILNTQQSETPLMDTLRLMATLQDKYQDNKKQHTKLRQPRGQSKKRYKTQKKYNDENLQ